MNGRAWDASSAGFHVACLRHDRGPPFMEGSAGREPSPEGHISGSALNRLQGTETRVGLSL